MRIRYDLETLSTVSFNSAQNQLSMQENLHSSLIRYQGSLTESLTQLYQHVDRRIGNVEELLKVQAVHMQASQLNQLGCSYGRRPSYSRPPPPSRKQTQHQVSLNSEEVGMRVKQYGACRVVLAGVTCRQIRRHRDLWIGFLGECLSGTLVFLL